MTPERSIVVVLKTIVWTLAWLVVLDLFTRVAVSRLAAHHPDSGLVRYFEYGLSIEAKLDRMTRLPHDMPDARIIPAGWIDPDQWRALPTQPEPGTDKLVALYGQSFAFNATYEAVRLDGHLTFRGIGGPAAPPDHSYAAYLADSGNARADTVIFGILASSVSHIGSMSGMDWTFEHPAPYTFPRYRLVGGHLEAEAPAIGTEQQFRDAFTQRSAAWQTFKAQLARNDRGFSPVVFDRTWFDRSQIALLMRRGWVAHSQNYEDGVYDPGQGFAANSEPIQVLKAILVDMAARTRARGQRLIVLLEQDQGYGDSLFRVLGPTLDNAHVEFISTHTLFSVNDPRNFKSDGHYTNEANGLFARQIQVTIRNGPKTR